MLHLQEYTSETYGHIDYLMLLTWCVLMCIRLNLNYMHVFNFSYKYQRNYKNERAEDNKG